MKPNDLIFLDSESNVWLEQQLREREADAVRIERPALTAQTFFPVKRGDYPLADSISFRTLLAAGKAKIVANGSRDIPTLDLSANEVPYPVKTIAVQFPIENIDVARAQALGLPYESDYIAEAQTAVETEINRIAYYGDTEYGLPGLLSVSASGVTPQSAAHGSWASNVAAHPEYLRDDIAQAFAAWQNACQNRHPLTRIGLPVEEYNLIRTTVVSTYSDMTLINWLSTQLGFVSPDQIMPVPELADFEIDATTKNLMVLMSGSPDNVALRIPQDVEYTPPQSRMFGYDVACYARCGGLHVRRPLSLYIIKGI